MQSKLTNIFLLLLSGLAVYFFMKKMATPQDSVTTSESMVVEIELPTEFVTFYDKFQVDSLYQMEHILFPLKGITADENSMNKNYEWTSDNWQLHHPLDDMNGTYVTSFDMLGDLIIETTTATQFNFSMVRRFAKMDDGYKLIFYKNMGPN